MPRHRRCSWRWRAGRGDFNGDGQIDVADVDLLAKHDGRCDLNGDSTVNPLDMDILILQILNTRYGDANLDGRVNGVDFLAWQAGYQPGNAAPTAGPMATSTARAAQTATIS